MGGLITGLYWFFGYAEIPISVYSSPLTETTDMFLPLCSSPADLCANCSKIISYRVSPIIYIIAIVNLIGFVVLVFFGGVGLIALPMDLILEFIHRPKYISLQEYSKRKIDIGSRAEKILKQGQKLKQDREEATKLKKGKRKEIKRIDKEQKEFKQSVLILERDYEELTEVYQNQGGNIIFRWFKVIFFFFFLNRERNLLINSFFSSSFFSSSLSLEYLE